MQAIAPFVGQRESLVSCAHAFGISQHRAEDVHLDCSSRSSCSYDGFGDDLVGIVDPIISITLGLSKYWCIFSNTLPDGLDLGLAWFFGSEGNRAWSTSLLHD